MEEQDNYFICPNRHPDGRRCFTIHKSKLIEFLTDSQHPAHRFMSAHEREMLDEALTNIIKNQ